ncbi:MAG: NCS2 family permease [Candidatus Methylacidiphilales bacterium]
MVWLDQVFHLRQNHTTVSREVLAGVTTFAAMAYILAVNPSILANAGMDRGAALTATALASALGCFLMGLLTNLPIAQAPGMGLNAFFTYSICLGAGVPWQGALGLVFYSGVLFFILSVTGARRKIIEAIPASLKVAVSVGIGLFIAFLGLQGAGLVAANPNTMVGLGKLSDFKPWLALAGVVVAAGLIGRRVPGAILITVILVAAAGLLLPGAEGKRLTQLPGVWVSAPASLDSVFLALDPMYLWSHFRAAFPLVLALLFVDLFDTMGTLLGVCHRGGFVDEEGNIPRINRALAADATASMTGAILGTSTTTSYIESAAGIEEGGRTGLTACVVGVCFILALAFTPLFLAIPPVATAPALIVVGIFMMQGLRDLPLGDWVAVVPALVTVMGIPLTFSISDGIALGFIVYVGLMLGLGRARELSWLAIGLAAIFVLHFVTA